VSETVSETGERFALLRDSSLATEVMSGGTVADMSLPAEFLADTAAVLPAEAVIREPEQLKTYECDGLTGHRMIPALVVLPRSTPEVQAVVRLCHKHGVPFVARGAGTGLSGGALPVADGIVISLARMDKILETDLAGGRVVVEPGVTNLAVTEAVSADGFFYAPDPSSQQVCTIGGNLAENSGGAHCLKYGFTVNHVTAVELVLADGELVTLELDAPGPDLLGAVVGSEGTLGIATKITLRVVRRPETVRTLLAGFRTTDEAGAAVSEVIAARILPAAIEMMDRLTREAAEAAVQADYPHDAGAILIVELDGVTAQVEDDLALVEEICRRNGAGDLRVAADDDERALLWKGRKAAFAAMGRVSPDYYVQDGVVPRTRLPAVLHRIGELEAQYGLRVGNVFHAGDGNLHPLVLYDGSVEGEPQRAQQLAEAILEACVDAGGSITGEHGIGADKACSMPLLFGPDDLEAMQCLRRAFDPAGIANPGKIFPTPRLCGEVPGPYRAHPLERAGLAERF
jgi:glycolate dehydrogenase FAD-linked subunit